MPVKNPNNYKIITVRFIVADVDEFEFNVDEIAGDYSVLSARTDEPTKKDLQLAIDQGIIPDDYLD